MNTRDVERDLEDMEDWLQDIRSEDVPIIVEGLKDIRALEQLGIYGAVPFNRGETIVVFCEKMASENDRIIILTDWDRKGGHLARLMSEAFQADGVTYDLEYRARIAKLCKKETKDVEGLYQHYIRLKEKSVE